MHSETPKNNVYLVVMAGGIGSRFWPMSTPDNPKQFQDVLGIGHTLFQDTLKRFKKFVPWENIYVVTTEHYRHFVSEQGPEIPRENILAEPMRKNTAPCLAYATYSIRKRSEEGQIIVTPSDHFVQNQQRFEETISDALDWTSRNDQLLTLGITPDRPETGYGYIQFTKNNSDSFLPVREFKEKPDQKTAVSYLHSGEYLWNSGIFLWKTSTILDAFERHLPEVHKLFSDLITSEKNDDIVRYTYERSPNISIDYGILEKASNIYVRETNCGWSDLGTWGSLWMYESHDENHNSLVGERTILNETDNCIIRVPGEKEVIIDGLSDYIIVDDKEHLLIFRKNNEQAIGTLSKKFKEQN